MPMLRVQTSTLERVENFKSKLAHRSTDETVNWLCDKAEDPKAAIEAFGYFLSDLRGDVKKLLKLLESITSLLPQQEVK